MSLSRISGPALPRRSASAPTRLQRLNPSLVYCSISGFGADGPDAGRPAYDTVAQAASGWLRLLINPENPRVVGPAIADAITGFYAAFGVLGALYERQRTGRGRRVDVSMLEAMCHFNLDDFTHYFSQNEVMGPYSRPSVSQSYVFACSDDKWIALHMSSPEKFWQGLANALGLPHLFEDPRFADRPARIKHQEELIRLMTPIFRRHTREEWCARLSKEGVPFSPVYDSSEALQDPQARHLGIEVETRHPEMGRFRTRPLPGELRRRTPVGDFRPAHAGRAQRCRSANTWAASGPRGGANRPTRQNSLTGSQIGVFRIAKLTSYNEDA